MTCAGLALAGPGRGRRRPATAAFVADLTPLIAALIVTGIAVSSRRRNAAPA